MIFEQAEWNVHCAGMPEHVFQRWLNIDLQCCFDSFIVYVVKLKNKVYTVVTLVTKNITLQLHFLFWTHNVDNLIFSEMNFKITFQMFSHICRVLRVPYQNLIEIICIFYNMFEQGWTA